MNWLRANLGWSNERRVNKPMLAIGGKIFPLGQAIGVALARSRPRCGPSSSFTGWRRIALLSLGQLPNGGPREIIRKIRPLCPPSSAHPRSPPLFLPSDEQVSAESRSLGFTVSARACAKVYVYPRHRDSPKTLGFNPRTPTLRLRPMTSRLLLEYQCCSLRCPLRISARINRE